MLTIREIPFDNTKNKVRDLCKDMIAKYPNNRNAVKDFHQSFEKIYKKDKAKFFELLEKKDTNTISPKLLLALFAPPKIRDWLSEEYKKQHQKTFDTFAPNTLEADIYAKCQELIANKKIEEIKKIVIASIQDHWSKINILALVALYQAPCPKEITIFDEKTKQYIPTPIEEVEKKLDMKHFTSNVVIESAHLSLLKFEMVTTDQFYTHLLVLRHHPKFGWYLVAKTDIPVGTEMGRYEGVIRFRGDTLVCDAEETIGQHLIGVSTETEIASHKIFISARNIGGPCSRMMHLPTLEERDNNYNFDRFPIKDYVATANVMLKPSATQSLLKDTAICDRHIGQAVKAGALVGFSYGENEYFQQIKTTPHIFDHKGRVIPRLFYDRNLLICKVKGNEKNFAFVGSKSVRDSVQCYMRGEVDKINPKIFSEWTYMNAEEFKQELIEQGYIPSKPTYNNPNNYPFEFRTAAANDEFDKLWYMLQWDEKKKEIQAFIADAKSSNGNTALHWSAQKGHMWIVLLLLQYGNNVQCYYTQTNNLGKTPYALAKENGHLDLIEVVNNSVKLQADKNRQSSSAQTTSSAATTAEPLQQSFRPR